MRLIYTLFTLAASGYGLFWLAEKNPELKDRVEEMLNFRTTNALESRFDASQIMEAHQKTLLKEKGARFLDPELKFFPLLLMEVKYLDSKNKTKESLILWDLTDGEMILNTKTWEKTHGFADCIVSRTQPAEFNILRTLSNKGGCDISTLTEKLEVEMPTLEVLLRSCMKKNLIIPVGANKYRLHLENPKIGAAPETKLQDQLTTRPHKRAQRASHHFKASQIERMAKVAFGENFSIRTKSEIFLPVHRIVVQTPDGAIRTHHFNALNGNELPSAPFYQ